MGFVSPLAAGAALTRLPSSIIVVRELLDVVQQAIQLPLRADLGAAAQGEAIEPHFGVRFSGSKMGIRKRYRDLSSQTTND